MAYRGHQGACLSSSTGTAAKPAHLQRSGRVSPRSAYFMAYELNTFM